MAPDLRESSVPTSAELFSQVLHDGILRQQGMPAFPEFTAGKLDWLRHFIIRTIRSAAAGRGEGAHDEEMRH